MGDVARADMVGRPTKVWFVIYTSNDASIYTVGSARFDSLPNLPTGLPPSAIVQRVWARWILSFF
jgi:hypothetical protein